MKNSIYKLENENQRVYKETTFFTKDKFYNNLYIKKTKTKGYGVFTSARLKASTLLMRYAGEVLYQRDIDHKTQEETDKIDDLLMLIETKNRNYDRVVLCERWCNLARFINHSSTSTNNVSSVVVIKDKNQIEVLLYTIKIIEA